MWGNAERILTSWAKTYKDKGQVRNRKLAT